MAVMTRQQLFEAAWTRPLTHVAADIGVTSTALKKTCSRHDIPTPSRGYWRAVEAGGVFRRPTLPPVRDKRLEEVRIRGARPLPPVVKAALEAARAAAPPPESQKRAAPRSRPASAAEVVEPETPAKTAAPGHPALARTRKALAKARPSSADFLRIDGEGVVTMTVGPASRDRALSVLDGLFFAAEARGWSVSAEGKVVRLVVEGEPVAFHLDEKPDRTLHAPTAKELAEKARRTWATTDPWPKYDLSPSGRLQLVIDENDYSGLRRTYSDTQSRQLEEMLEDVLVAFAGHAALIRQRREEREERARAHAEAERVRAEEAAFEAREKRRLEFADAVAQGLAERDRMAAVLRHLQGDHDPALNASMVAWLERRVRLLEARVSPVFVEISARSAEVDFEEPRPAAAAPENAWRYYGKPVGLHLWSEPDGDGMVRSMTARQWTLKDSSTIADQTPPSVAGP